MKRLALSFIIGLLSLAWAVAQDKATLSLERVTAEELFREIERQTSFRIYCREADTDSLTLTFSCTDMEAPEALRQALLPAGLKVSVFDRALFIAKDRELITSLHPSYYNQTEASWGAPFDLSGLATGGGERQRASSENPVYEIGIAATALSGKAKLSGNVIDFRSGEPVAGATVSVSEPMTGTTTDASGFYSLELPAGRYELNIRRLGMKDASRQLRLHSDGTLDIELDEQVYALQEVSVSSERLARIRTTAIGVERLAIRNIKNMPTAFGEVDIMKAVLSLPGVKSAGEASSGFNVRGGATDQNLILFNGGTVYNPTHLFGVFSAFNPDVVKDMELYKSSIPPQYGGRISSALEVGSREGNKKKFEGSASLGILTSSLTLEGPIAKDRTSVLAGFRTTYSDWILKSLPDNSGYNSGSAGFYDASMSVGHRFNERNSISINGYFSRDRFNFDASDGYTYRNANASLAWRRIFGDRLTGSFSAGYDHYDYLSRNSVNPAEAYSMSFAINQQYVRGGFSWYAAAAHTLDFGLSGLYYDLNPGAYLPEGPESIVVPNLMQREKALESALYADWRWDLSRQLSVNAGLRYSHFGALGPREYNAYKAGVLPSLSDLSGRENSSGGFFKTYGGPEYRISARYAFTDELSFKAGLNSMRQYIHKLSNTTVMSPVDTWKLSDANVLPQDGMQIAAGLYRNFAGHTVETSIELYYKTMNNYPDYRRGAELLMNPHIETDILPAQGRAFGIELMAKKTQGKLNGWASYTFSRAMLRQSDPRIPEPVNSGQWYAADFDKPHEFKLAGNYRFTQRFSISMNCDYSTGRPVTLPVSKYRMAGGEFVYYSDRNRYRIPDFFRVDMAINIEPSHHLTLLTRSSFSIGVYNATARRNAYSVYYIAEEGRLQGYRLAIFGVPIPYISYNIKF